MASERGQMRYEVIQDRDEWIVSRDGRELARFADQDAALTDVAARLKTADPSTPSSLSVRYQTLGDRRFA